MEYRGVEINLFETKTVLVDVEGQKYEVTNGDGLVFGARSKFGASYASTSEAVLGMAYDLIDQNLGMG